jgi:FAD:protein FMN transferase
VRAGGSGSAGEAGAGAGGGPRIDGAPLDGLLRFSHDAMATVFEVHAAHPDARYAAQAAQAAFDLTDRLEQELSRFRSNSDITRINHLGAGARMRVSVSALECLVIARHLFELTGGVFDVSLGTGLPSLELDPERSEVRATAAGVRIDLGGIGKGYAVDRMAEVLEEWGIERAFVHGGFSSVLALEPPAGRDGWPLTLSDPGPPSRVVVRLSARQTALGASGLRKGDHIVDPRTGEPVTGRLAAWVAVPRPAVRAVERGPRMAPAAVADALATACMALPPDAIEEICGRSPGLEVWTVSANEAGPDPDARLRHFGSPVR